MRADGAPSTQPQPLTATFATHGGVDLSEAMEGATITRIRRVLLSGAAIAVLSAPLGLPEAVAAPSRAAQARPEVTTNTTDLAVGTELVVTGTGCRDDASGSAAGFRVGVGLHALGESDAPPVVSLVQPPTFDPEPDGSWELSTTIAQPLPPGPVELVARCYIDPDDFGAFTNYEPVRVSITLPPLTGVQVEGATITADYPCDLNTPLGGAFIYDGGRRVATVTDVTVDDAATTVTFVVPDEVPSGTYQLVATCQGPRSGLMGSFAATVEYAPPAPSATPVQRSPSFTG